MNAEIIITSIKEVIKCDWFGIAFFFFILFCFAVVCLLNRIGENKMLKRIIKLMDDVEKLKRILKERRK